MNLTSLIGRYVVCETQEEFTSALLVCNFYYPNMHSIDISKFSFYQEGMYIRFESSHFGFDSKTRIEKYCGGFNKIPLQYFLENF